MLKNKWIIIGIVAVLVMIAAGAYVVMSGGSSEQVEDEGIAEESFVNMSPEDIGLVLEPSGNGREVVMTISDTSKFTSFEYEMNYEAEIDGELVSRGAIGSGEVEEGEEVERNITIGTCSSGTCKYDTGVKEINFVLKLTLKSGETALVEDSIVLEE